MTLKPTKLGADPRKLALLGVLVAAAIYLFLSNRTSDDASAPGRGSTAQASSGGAPVRPIARSTARTERAGLNHNLKEFRPSLKAKDMDRSAIDPTLHLDLLAKLQGVDAQSGARSLFSEGTPPPPEVTLTEPGPIKPKYVVVGPPAPPKPGEVKTPPAPQAPPIPLKYYGFVNPQRSPGPKRAFFLDGDDIIVAGEGDMVKKRYKIVRIGINSAVVEDTQFENAQNKEQTLPLVEEQAG